MARGGPVRVVLADDDARFRAAVREVLHADERFAVAGEQDSGHGLGRFVRTLAADVVLVDVRMPGGGALAVTDVHAEYARERATPPPVVGLSAQVASATVAALFAAGAAGFAAKGASGTDLPELLLRCAAGELVLGVPQAERAVRQALGPDAGRGAALVVLPG